MGSVVTFSCFLRVSGGRSRETTMRRNPGEGISSALRVLQPLLEDKSSGALRMPSRGPRPYGRRTTPIRRLQMTVLRESNRVKRDEVEQDWSHVRGFGWRPQLPDARDRLYMARLKDLPPAEYDLRPSMPAVYDQGQLGSCTGNAIAAAMEFERDRQGLSDFVPSRLFIYYNE